ncbi:Zinc finger MYM-type protein 1-like [Oopsacas minuta]|uniref:Zinc finger MYM-type protein 1-like n=1 Tax=Oopsacas minuta TaxID=111878 RepID=A0AAV7KFQ2_9METZ|nr:Zinc finger MYM-type protein 1-like [Oopsacas minuta]
MSEETDPAVLEDIHKGTLHEDDYVSIQVPNLGIQYSEKVYSPSKKDISMSREINQVQPRTIKFPLHMIGKQYRAFTSSLYDRYPWIEYSECEDGIYCYHCDISPKQKIAHFVSQSMRNGKKCYGTTARDNTLMQQQVSLQHAECVDAYPQYQAVKSGSFLSVAKLQDFAHTELITENRIYMRTLCEVWLFTAQRKIAQRETGR